MSESHRISPFTHVNISSNWNSYQPIQIIWNKFKLTSKKSAKATVAELDAPEGKARWKAQKESHEESFGDREVNAEIQNKLLNQKNKKRKLYSRGKV